MNLIKLLQAHPFYAEHIYSAIKMYIDAGLFLSGSCVDVQMRAIKEAALADAKAADIAKKA